jgi:hypothetical protein
VHREKHPRPMISTEAGRQIDWKDEQWESACASSVMSFEFDSNGNDESDVQLEKHLLPIMATEPGRQIARNE